MKPKLYLGFLNDNFIYNNSFILQRVTTAPCEAK